MRILVNIILLIFFVSCSTSSEKGLQLLFSSENCKILGSLKNGLLIDSLLYYQNDSLILKQTWTDGILQKTYYNHKNQIRELNFVNRKINSLTFEQHYSDINDSTFRIYPYDSVFLNFYNKTKVLVTSTFREKRETTVSIFNVPTELSALAIVGGNVKNKELSYNYLVLPTRKEGDSLKVYVWITGLHFPKEYKSFKIEK